MELLAAGCALQLDWPLMTSSPRYCRPSAHNYLRKQLPRLDTTAGLVHAAVAVSMHELGDVNVEHVDGELDRLRAW